MNWNGGFLFLAVCGFVFVVASLIAWGLTADEHKDTLLPRICFFSSLAAFVVFGLLTATGAGGAQ